MGAANGSTFDLTTARRPSSDDTGESLVLVDDVANPPDPNTMPTSAPWNTFAALTRAYGGVVAHTKISIHVVSGTPGISLVGSARKGVVAGTFTVTDNGAGDTSITWAAGTFPPPIANPEVSVNTLASLAAVIAPITNGVRVQVRNDAGALTDGDFTAVIN